MCYKRLQTGIIGVLFVVLFSGISFAQNQADTKLDTVLENQQKMLSIQQEILANVDQDPLADKKFGIEFNPAFLLIASADDNLVLSGGLSMFDVDRNAELAFPIFIRNNGEGNYTGASIDAHYRRFFGKNQGGLYISGSARFKVMSGEEDSDNIPIFNFGDEEVEERSVSKLGIGFGVGYRKFSQSGLFWGTSFTIGRYFTGTDTRIRGDESEIIGGDAYFDIEFFKFGFAF